MKFFGVVLLLSLTYGTWGHGAVLALRESYLSLPYEQAKTLNVRIGIMEPAGPAKGDVLYFHGFADRLDNHDPLFQAWSRAGLRVIAFDLPSHGEDWGSANNLNDFGFKELADLAARVEQEAKPQDGRRPLILAGWSAGGLIVVRMLQEGWTSGLSRPVSGVILFAPGVSVRKFPWTFGNRLGEVTEATLTHDPHPPHRGPIKPDSPFWNKLIVGFAPDLIFNSVLSQDKSLPVSLSALVFTAGDKEDMYAKGPVVRAWVSEQNLLRARSGTSPIIGISCPHSRHEMDNELPAFGGDEVRETAAAFASAVADGSQGLSGVPTFGSVCTSFTP